MRRLASFVAGLIAGVALMGTVGCNGSVQRTLDPINAEQQSLNTTKPFAKAYVEKYPAEKQEVDDFYATWQGRLDREKAAASSTNP